MDSIPLLWDHSSPLLFSRARENPQTRYSPPKKYPSPITLLLERAQFEPRKPPGFPKSGGLWDTADTEGLKELRPHCQRQNDPKSKKSSIPTLS